MPIGGVSTLEEYVDVLFPCLRSQQESAQRLDVVWDMYTKNSIKESTREKRGKGARRKVKGQNKIPGKWRDFLRDSGNTQEQLAFLSDKSPKSKFPSGKEVIATRGQGIVMTGSNHCMAQCDHEEADTRVVLHLQDALKNGSAQSLVHTFDADVVVILLEKFCHLRNTCPAADPWVPV